MKSLPTILILFLGNMLFSGFTVWAQSPIVVKANDFVTTTIFFPSNIEKVVAPGPNFQFTYEEGSNIGLLKGRKGKVSNLLVITELGYVYSFALSYAEEVLAFNFILTTDQAITKNILNTKQSTKISKVAETTTDKSKDHTNGNQGQESTQNGSVDQDGAVASNSTSESNGSENTPENESNSGISTNGSEQNNAAAPIAPNTVQTASGNEQDLYDVDREEYYKIFCENNYLQKTTFKRSFRQNKKIAVRLNNILIDRNEKYFVLQIENNSKREYKVEGLSFFRKSDVGQLEKIMNPLHSYNLQDTIDPESINEVVYVFPNFKIGAKEKIIVALADANSDNMVILPLDDLLINFPSN